MHESSLPGADRRSSNDPSGLQRRLVAILHASPAPTICVPRSQEEGGDLMLAGATLLDLVRFRVTALQRAGMRRGDTLVSNAVGASRVVDALAALLGGFTYWPSPDHRRIADGPLLTVAGAPLLWRPNPLIGMTLAPGLPHEPPVALPMRQSAQLRDLMAPAGAHVSVLADGGTTGHPFAINAQTLARLGSTLRRRLGIRTQSVRYCAAPAPTAAGVLLDLLPGIAARQVMVVPNELYPSPVTIVRAIGRYCPDSMTLTLDQARALIDTPMDEQILAALSRMHLLVADSQPIPASLRQHLAVCVGRLDVAYILPEAGDVYVM
jgi:hypothetical protein